MDSSTTTLWTGLFLKAGCLASFNYKLVFLEIPGNANGVDSDQTPRSVASDLGKNCFLITHLVYCL